MFTAFLESVKYVGHLVPLAFLRVFLGYYYLQHALRKFNGDFLTRPRLAAQVADILPGLEIPHWYKDALEKLVIQHWQAVSFSLMCLEFAIAISYLLGYVVRPMAVIAALLSINALVLSHSSHDDFYRMMLALHLALAWVGAGRCLGIDYYYFKRRRGIWW